VLTSLGSRWASIDELLLLPAAARPVPWLDVWIDQMRNALMLLPALALLVHLVGKRFGTRRAVGFLGLAVLLFAAEGARSPAEFGLQLAIGGASAAVLVFVLGYLFRGNELAYVLSFIAGRGLGTAALWIMQPNASLRLTGIVAGVLLLATLGAVLLVVMRRPVGETAPASG
jgi:hypothetical protein